MLDAITRYSRPKLMSRDSGSSTRGSVILNAQPSRPISSDEPRRTRDQGPEPTFASANCTETFSPNHTGDSHRGGHSLKQTLVKFRRQGLRPLSLIRNRRPSHSRESIESTDSEQSQVGATEFLPSSNNHSSHVIPRAVLENGGEYVLVDCGYAPDLPNILQPPNSMPEISSSDICLKDDRKTWGYNLEGLPCEIGSLDKLVAEEGSDGSLDDEMLDTLCTLRYTIQQIQEYRSQPPQSSPLVKYDSLPTLGLPLTENNSLSRTFSVPARFIEDGTRPLSLLGGLSLQSCLISPAHLSNQLPGMHSDNRSTQVHTFSLPNPGMIKSEDEEDDTSSFCTLSEDEPDYLACPYVLPIWPNLPSALCPSFESKC